MTGSSRDSIVISVPESRIAQITKYSAVTSITSRRYGTRLYHYGFACDWFDAVRGHLVRVSQSIIHLG